MSNTRSSKPVASPMIYGVRVKLTKEDLDLLHELTDTTRRTMSSILREGLELVSAKIKKES